MGECMECGGYIWGVWGKVWVCFPFVWLPWLLVLENDCSLSGIFLIWGVSTH